MLNKLSRFVAATTLTLAASTAQSGEIENHQLKVLGTWSSLSQYKNYEAPFWEETLPTQRSKLEKFYYAHGKTIALRTALSNEATIEVVDSQPIDLGYERIEYHRMTAADYVSDRLG